MLEQPSTKFYSEARYLLAKDLQRIMLVKLAKSEGSSSEWLDRVNPATGLWVVGDHQSCNNLVRILYTCIYVKYFIGNDFVSKIELFFKLGHTKIVNYNIAYYSRN